MSELNTFEEVGAYVRKHGVDGLRMMVYQSSLAGRRKDVVESYLRHHDAHEDGHMFHGWLRSMNAVWPLQKSLV